ncbi:unnamed protein product [Didymodactylos carnosus]|uniref:G-protein coupled receptors family 3 profile domain-containing protein n=1 Tax=Didymodactylos carnosus TaxID=1234261 RepID=A0A8S2D3S2_9BILA|nr:unnamed protein product [Didymodactylos carnosus]CAF3656962.1 unnamed protein product [Didymodactylos carnosus]
MKEEQHELLKYVSYMKLSFQYNNHHYVDYLKRSNDDGQSSHSSLIQKYTKNAFLYLLYICSHFIIGLLCVVIIGSVFSTKISVSSQSLTTATTTTSLSISNITLTSKYIRLKRQFKHIDGGITSSSIDKYSYMTLIRKVFSDRTSSNIRDCTLNMPTDYYQKLQSNSAAEQIIELIKQKYIKELKSVKILAFKMKAKLSTSTSLINDFSISRLHEEYGHELRILLSKFKEIKEILITTHELTSFTYYNSIRYYRMYVSVDGGDIDDIDEQITHTTTKETNILLDFGAVNAYETLKNWNNKKLTTSNSSTGENSTSNWSPWKDGWWLGPVLCDNKNEKYLMAYILPLAENYFFVTYVNISNVDINQCASDNVPFGGTNKCHKDMECIQLHGYGFQLGAYECKCTSSKDNFTLIIKGFELETNKTNDLQTCTCNQSSGCQAEYNKILRYITVGIQTVFIIFVAVLAVIVFEKRKTKIIKHSMWILLELILLGAALLYASVIVDSFKPHVVVCLLMPWLREVGFTIVYGTLILRVYKMLAEFQSRKAHCVQVKEKDILRILFFICISIIGYLLAWTLLNIDHSSDKEFQRNLLGSGLTKDKFYFEACRPRWWDFLVQIAEFTFLCVGIRFIYSTRTAPSEYHERKLITISIACEMIFSTLLHIIRDCLWSTADPDVLFILSLIRCHATVTCMLVLIFCTKLCYIFYPSNDDHPTRDHRFRSLPDGIEPSDFTTKLQLNGDVEFGELNIRDMDPEDIRVELKRLYTSLHLLKTKTMRKDNPHLTKRGQRRKNRRFSMQAFQRHGGGIEKESKSTTHKEISEHEATKTPEDSTGSHEGPHGHTSTDENDDNHPVMINEVTTQRVTFK